MTVPWLDIVTVNWNSGTQLAECLNSIESFGIDHINNFIVVDNGSTDLSQNVSSERISVELIRAAENLGFSRACNLGAARTSAPWILFLNPDARLLPNSLNVTREYLYSHDAHDVAVVGIKIVNDNGSVERSSTRFPSLKILISQALGLNHLFPNKSTNLFMTEFDHLSDRDVDNVIGAFYLTRRELYQRLGGMDEAFFMYYEDLDFSMRTKSLGLRVRYLSQASAYHRGGGTSYQVKAHRLFYGSESRIIYAAKHMSIGALIAVAATTLLVEPFVRLLNQAALRSWSGVRDTWRGYQMIWAGLPSLIRQVRAVRQRR